MIGQERSLFGTIKVIISQVNDMQERLIERYDPDIDGATFAEQAKSIVPIILLVGSLCEFPKKGLDNARRIFENKVTSALRGKPTGKEA